jgi:threonine dehydrogenase-like Zn-dependent dehydrogenase
LSHQSVAAVLVAPEQFELQEFPLPTVGDDDGLLKVEAAGICGSDWAQFQGKSTGLPPVYPIIPGHEIVGRIHQVGERAASRWGVEVGDLVAVGMTIPGASLSSPTVYGLTQSTGTQPSLWGGYAEYMYLDPGSVLHRVPSGVSPAVAALYVPLANGVMWATYIPQLELGDIVVVQGPGQQGLGCVIASKEAGASAVIVTGTTKDRARLQVARELGADVTVNVDEEDPIEAVRSATNGRLADVVIDASAEATQPVAIALDLVRRGGRIVLAGLKDNAPVAGFVSDKLVLRGLTILSSSSPRGRPAHDPDKATRTALEIMASGRYPLEKLCSHTFRLDEAETAVRIVGRAVPGEDGIHVTISPTVKEVKGVDPMASSLSGTGTSKGSA